MKPKSAALSIVAIAVLASPAASYALENKYDVLAKVLMPFVNILAKQTKNPNRALTMKLRLEQWTGMAPELAGTRADLAVEYPDKLRLHGPLARRGDHGLSRWTERLGFSWLEARIDF